MDGHGGSMNELNETIKKAVLSLKDLPEDEALLREIRTKANSKEFGKEVTVQDILLMGLRNLTDKHIERLKENSLSSAQRIEREWVLAVKNENYKGSLDDFIWDNCKFNKGAKNV